MAMDLLIVGAGYTGERLARAGRERGWSVAGTTRSPETVEALESMGATAVEWDVREDEVGALTEYVDGSTDVVYSIPSLYRDYEAGDGEVPRHVAPANRVLEMVESEGAGRFIYLSSTSVYGDHDGAWVDEETPTDPVSPNGRMRRDIEELVLDEEWAIDTNVARLVGIYGPGRTMDRYVESGRYKLVDGGTKPTNRVHVDDIVGALVAIIDRAPGGARLYNVSDGHPKTVAEVVDWLVDHRGIERPEEVSLEEYRQMRGPNAAARWENTYRVSNERLVEELDVELAYPDVFAGYSAIFADQID